MAMMSWACYFARPLDAQLHVGRDKTLNPAAALLDEIRAALDAAGAQVYDPGTAMLVPKPDGNPFAQQVHDGALEVCKGVLGWLPDGVPTIGVPIELAKARQRFKPCVVVGGVHAAKSTVLASLEIPVFEDPKEAALHLHGMVIDLHAARSTVFQDGEPMEIGHAEELERYTQPDDFIVSEVEDPLTVAQRIPIELRAELARFWIQMRNEVERGVIKHPLSNNREWTSSDRWFAICIEELVEQTLAMLQRWNDVYHSDPQAREHMTERVTWEDVQAELVQAASMSFRLWEAIRFEKGGEGATAFDTDGLNPENGLSIGPDHEDS